MCAKGNLHWYRDEQGDHFLTRRDESSIAATITVFLLEASFNARLLVKLSMLRSQ